MIAGVQQANKNAGNLASKVQFFIIITIKLHYQTIHTITSSLTSLEDNKNKRVRIFNTRVVLTYLPFNLFP